MIQLFISFVVAETSIKLLLKKKSKRKTFNLIFLDVSSFPKGILPRFLYLRDETRSVSPLRLNIGCRPRLSIAVHDHAMNLWPYDSYSHCMIATPVIFISILYVVIFYWVLKKQKRASTKL